MFTGLTVCQKNYRYASFNPKILISKTQATRGGYPAPTPTQDLQSSATIISGLPITPLPNQTTFLNSRVVISRLGEAASMMIV